MRPSGGLTVIAFSNNHLQYALTWFGLALMLIAGTRPGGSATSGACVGRRQRELAALHHTSTPRIGRTLALLIQLRWIAVLGQVITIAIVHFGLRIPCRWCRWAMVLVALLALNALESCVAAPAHLQISSQALFSALLLDVAALTVQLYFSGGATNPFTALYLLQIALAAVLLPGRGALADRRGDVRRVRGH